MHVCGLALPLAFGLGIYTMVIAEILLIAGLWSLDHRVSRSLVSACLHLGVAAPAVEAVRCRAVAQSIPGCAGFYHNI